MRILIKHYGIPKMPRRLRWPLLLLQVLLYVALLQITHGCAGVPKRVTVPSSSLTSTVLAGAAREAQLADELIVEAHQARDDGDDERCRELARLALRTRAKARPLAYGLLYLANISIPGIDGEPPPPSEVEPADVDAECKAGG